MALQSDGASTSMSNLFSPPVEPAPYIAVFCDFDGTITIEDSGDKFFQRFSPEFASAHADLDAGASSVAEYYRRTAALLPKDLSVAELEDFARDCPIDPYFSVFAAFCREHGIPLGIISDGFDAYINPIVRQNRIFPDFLVSNTMQPNHNGEMEPIFLEADEACLCSHLCASCKRNAMLKRVHPDSVIVYIGDGRSDQCAALHADVIFAKKQLASFCATERVPHHNFHSFFDILRILRPASEKKTLRVRHQAYLHRKKAFETE